MKGTKPGRHFAFIIHGARARSPAVEHLIAWVREKGHHVDRRVTVDAGDATAFARAAATAGCDAVVAIGGDGTANEVINGLDGLDVPFGLIPLGTANDFARQVGIPINDADHAMDVILRRKPVRIDTAELNGRRFLNVSTAGLGAEATAETPAEAKAQLGLIAYAITGVRKLAAFRTYGGRFHAPGFEYAGKYLLFAVGNGRETGGGTRLTPRAKVNDGLLDLCLLEAISRADFARLVMRIKRGEHLADERVHYAQVPWLRVESRSMISVNADGEFSGAKKLDYRARPGDLQMYVRHLPGEGDEG